MQEHTYLGGERLDGIPAGRGVAGRPRGVIAFFFHARDAGQHLQDDDHQAGSQS